jgi:hypothetical protein
MPQDLLAYYYKAQGLNSSDDFKSSDELQIPWH